MKKKFQLLLLVCVISTAKAQTFTPPAFADVDNNYRTYVNNVFGVLESNRVTTGFLADYGFDFTDPKIYNGSVLVDSTLLSKAFILNCTKPFLPVSSITMLALCAILLYMTAFVLYQGRKK